MEEIRSKWEEKKQGNSGTSKDPKEIKNEFESINEDQSEQEQDDKETQWTNNQILIMPWI